MYFCRYVAARLLQRKRRDAVEAWGRERRQFLDESRSVLEESSRANEAAARAAADRLAHELVREVSFVGLSHWEVFMEFVRCLTRVSQVVPEAM